MKFRIRMFKFLVLAAFISVVAGCSTPSLPMSQRVECYRPKVAVLPLIEAQSESIAVKYTPEESIKTTEALVTDTASVPVTSISKNTENAVSEDEGSGQSSRSHNTLRNLKSGDRVIIHLRGIPSAVEINDVIDGWGEVTLPFIGEVKLADKTISEAERKIEKSYIDGGIYKQINVIIVAEDEVYFIQGEVARQGKYSLSGAMTLRQAITEAGGCTSFANRKKIKITRGDKILMYNGKDIAIGKSPDPPVLANDIIEVYKRKW